MTTILTIAFCLGFLGALWVAPQWVRVAGLTLIALFGG